VEPTSISTSDAGPSIGTSWPGRARTYARRLSQVVRVFMRFGFDWVFTNLGLEHWLPRRRRTDMDMAAEALEMPERLRLALEELGPTAIKLGQSLASRGDLVPAAYVSELRRLQDDLPPVPLEEVRGVIREELGEEIEALFPEFEEEPRAAASIGQVHFARLADGQAVAVKVQRPGVAQAIEIDLHILMRMAHHAERSLPWAAENHVQDLVHEFVRSLRDELDYLNEGHNTERLADNLRGDETVVVPRIFWDLSTRRVLIVEWVEGAKPGDAEAMAKHGVDANAAARNLLRQMVRQVMRDGYFHGDPHAGNILFLGGDRVAFLDCGNAVAIDRNTREGLVSILMAALNDDPQEVCDYLLMLGTASEKTDPQRLVNDVGRMMAHYKGFRSTAQINIGELLDDLLSVVMRHGVRMQPAFPAIAKSLMVTEGQCLQLDPKFDAQDVIRHEGRDLLLGRLAPRRLTDDLLRLLRTIQRYAQLLPRQLSQVLTRAQSGGMTLRVSHENLERPLKRLDLMVNRIVFAIVVSAIIGSSTNLLSRGTVTGTLGELLTYGYLTVGVVLGGWLLYSILRSGRL
jgi:ubiquinone biosynthesis protein